MDEIERRFLLTSLPEKVEKKSYSKTFCQQLYLRNPDDNDYGGAERFTRKVTLKDTSCKNNIGEVKYSHNFKIGAGLIRQEYKAAIDAEVFYALWELKDSGGNHMIPRLHKVRYKVVQNTAGIKKIEGEVDSFIWEIDYFADKDLYLAEVELPWEDCPHVFPNWLEPYIEKEVTNDPKYTGSRLAK
jgi:CYTH domain-containing protein